MNVRSAYREWSKQYDTNRNRTRDAEALVLKELTEGLRFKHILEIGCGTGKNTTYLLGKCEELTAVDLSEEMLAVARTKNKAGAVRFVQADVMEDWKFLSQKADLITFSLVLEHIENLEPIFKKVAEHGTAEATVYIGELHPFKQYNGSKARFETDEGVHEVSCFTHHVSDFVHSAEKYGFGLIKLTEYFDDDDRLGEPRILGLLLKKRPC